MKKKFLLILIMGVLMFSLNGCVKEEKENNESEEKKPEYVDQVIDGVKISNINLDIQNGETTITAVAHNTTSENLYLRYIDIVFYDKNNNEIASSFFYIDKNISVDGVEALQTSISSDISNTDRIEFKISK